jgi:adenosylcobinamide-phosphate synthase
VELALTPMTEPAVVLVLAWLADRWLGEPPSAVHPVVWIGRATGLLIRAAPAAGALRQLLFGAAVAAIVPATFAAGAWALLRLAAPLPLVELVLAVYLLKASFSLGGLRDAAHLMQGALAHGLPDARAALQHLCSRDPSALGEPELVGATVESLAENTSDSVVAPLLWYAVCGVPGAIAYRAVNTLDAMIGYRGAYEHLGKTAARLDDLLNLVPARVTALLLLLGGALRRHDVRGGARVLWRDRTQTASPNAGWPMSAMAGLLGVRLDKPHCYRLGDAVHELGPEAITGCLGIVITASWVFAGSLLLALVAAHD